MSHMHYYIKGNKKCKDFFFLQPKNIRCFFLLNKNMYSLGSPEQGDFHHSVPTIYELGYKKRAVIAYVSSRGSRESAHMHSLTRTYAVLLCNLLSGRSRRNFCQRTRLYIATDKAPFSSEKCQYLSYFSTKTYVVGTH